MGRVGDLVTQVHERVRVEPTGEYRLLGVKWYGEGVFFREAVRGDNSSASYFVPVSPGAFIYNRLFAWKASFAVVPPEYAGHFVSSEFPQFVVDADRILPEYLYLFFTRTSTIVAVNRASVGSAAVSRNRFKEEEFVEFELPLPPLEVQQAIVARWQHAQKQLDAARKALVDVVTQLNDRFEEEHQLQGSTELLSQRWLVVRWCDLARWDTKTARAAAFRLSALAFRPMGDFIEESTELVRPWEEPDKDWPVYGVNNRDGVFFSYYQKGAEFKAPYKRIRKDWFFHNPTRSAVGSLGIVPAVPEDAITSPEYQVWRIRDGLVPGYVAAMISTPFFVNLVQFHRVGAVKQRLFVRNLLEIPIPVLAEDEQSLVAERREAALAELEAARVNIQSVQAEVEAMILGEKPAPGRR